MPDSYRRLSHLDSDPQALTLKRLRQLSRILDKVVTIPGTPIHIGLDPLVGFLPIGGDILGVILASYIVIEAARIGVPKGMLSRMVLNVIIDGLVGTVPIMGDLFDFAWTANEYNIKLLEEHLQLTLPRSK
ncbi:DUF4112 domain-containing protein [Anabaenopsis tanganyikae CS-531]|jgi:hypothetical protein|uniref:DUF4112 domain-containing protein n=2 Tax=Anabaenopsis TaxID=110103 RepID=A0ABT5AS72_9CYAN|nr:MULTISPECIES: DUF4112 domain-containing protein [Nostocales]MDB9447462.1 DUF4112 domain-containing protein [Anabaena sp. CS-542/02]MDB9539739.1 DUF4112 domain-containing protein [Anabaenopsis arnoldii]MDH6092044.1 DUF4112 domain-containing protein [Anabaenopsis arnoldii]MDH6105461.1 DUF4112 domain-containing protein [Anabaenopsis tanganyikae CS-531]